MVRRQTQLFIGELQCFHKVKLTSSLRLEALLVNQKY